MGEIADLALEGVVCETCLDYVGDGEGVGYPRRCEFCEHEAIEMENNPDPFKSELEYDETLGEEFEPYE
jgi:hypothetical protein